MSPSELRQVPNAANEELAVPPADVGALMEQIGRAALDASSVLAQASTQQKNAALVAAAKAIRSGVIDILAANAKDMDAARARNLTGALLDRLKLDESRIEGIARAI